MTKNKTVKEQEIETKILEIKHDDYKDRVLELGGELILNDTISSFAYTSNLKDWVRFRHYGSRNEFLLTIKNRTSEEFYKIHEQLRLSWEETKNLDHNTWCFIRDCFRLIGHKEYRSIKKRISYKIGNVRLDFDKELHYRIPPYLEIEGVNYDEIVLVAKQLGISEDKLTNLSWNEVLNHYGITE